jgi:hypothetical protein
MKKLHFSHFHNPDIWKLQLESAVIHLDIKYNLKNLEFKHLNAFIDCIHRQNRVVIKVVFEYQNNPEFEPTIRRVLKELAVKSIKFCRVYVIDELKHKAFRDITKKRLQLIEDNLEEILEKNNADCIKYSLLDDIEIVENI